MTTKGAFFSIAGFLVLSFLVGFRNADTTPWSETSAAIPKEETLVIEKFVSDGLRTECAADIGFCCVDDEGFCFDPKPNGFSASGGLRTRCITYTRNYLAPKLIGFSASDGLHTECVADTGFCLDPKPNGLSASE